MTAVCNEVTFDPAQPMFIDPQMLAKSGEILLERVQQVFAEAGVTLPPRQIWMAGEAVYDCEQLGVSLLSLRAGALPNSTTVPPSPCVVIAVAVFAVSVVRCIPVPDDRGKPPTPAALAAAANITATDAWVLMKGSCKLDLWEATVEQNPWNYSPGGGMGVEASVAVETAAGGMQAVTLSLTTMIG